MRIIILQLLIILLPVRCLAQLYGNNSEDVDLPTTGLVYADSLSLPSLSKIFYSDVDFLSHTYDYERINMANKFRMYSREVMTVGYAVLLGSMFLNGYLADEYGWSLWVDIPCATVVAIAITYPFVRWSIKLKEKATAMETPTISLYNLDSSIDLCAVSMSVPNTPSSNTVGLGIKIKF